MMKWTGTIVTGLMAVLLLVGCHAQQAPTARVQSIQVTDRTVEGARLEVTVRVSNPNDTPLPVQNVEYTIRVEDVGRFHFQDKPAVTLPPRGEQTIVLAAAFANGQRVMPGQSVRTHGQVRYQRPGQIASLLAEYQIPYPEVPFEGTGQIVQAPEVTAAGK